jgi:NADPH-dependent 2,4-dienoyl-CoA reductase/sulfur reductase-like enzyme
LTDVNDASRGPVVVVGAGLSGSRTCTELRKHGYPGQIILIGAERSLPYDRPPLSKAVIRGKRESKPLKVDYAGLEIDVRLDTVVESVDLAKRQVACADGPVEFAHLVIATGADPIRLPGSGEQLLLRTDVEAVDLRDRLVAASRVVVIGASWIGAEVAHAALESGCTVVGLECERAPLARALGAEIGARFAQWWDGAQLRTGVRVSAVEPDGVHLDSGEIVPADVVVTGVGVRPATAWLATSGLELLPAVAVDEYLRTADPAVYALGDAAAWWSPRFGRRMDVQHWDDAYSAPTVVASAIVHGTSSEVVHDPVPYFWSDQFGHRIEYVGHHGPADAATIDDGFDSGWTARWTDPSGRLTAALGVDQSKLIAELRKQLMSAGHAVAEGQQLGVSSDQSPAGS